MSEPTKEVKKGKDKEKEIMPEAPLGVVLYTDGGCRPNPGYGGWGVHGYLYRDEKPKKGAGNPDHILTNRGYMTKAAAASTQAGKAWREVAPVEYIDGFGSFLDAVTNNIAEIAATTAALEYVQRFAELKSVMIRTDSEHVRKGLEGWVDGWIRNGWVKQDGTPPANVQYWKELVQMRDVLRSRGVDVQIEWVKAHDDILGNVQADRLATIAVMVSKSGELAHELTATAAEGYWKYEPDRHPMLNHRRLYMNTREQFNRPGEYYIGEHGKDDDLLGKRISDGAFALVRLEKPDTVLEMLRNRQIEAAGEIDTLVMLRLDHIYRSDVHQRIVSYGKYFVVQPDPSWLHLEDLDEESISRELRPPKLALRAVEAIEELGGKLEQYLRRDAQIVVTDLTPILYEKNVKVDKKGETTATMKLKADYNVGFASLEVDAQYSAGNELSSASVILTLGIDMLDRNSLKRLEDRLPQVSLITWSEAPNVFRYATVVEAGNDKGIWAGVYSNLRVVT